MAKDRVTNAIKTSVAVVRVLFLSFLMHSAPIKAQIPLGITRKQMTFIIHSFETSTAITMSCESLKPVDVKRIKRMILKAMIIGIVPMAIFAVKFLLTLVVCC